MKKKAFSLAEVLIALSLFVSVCYALMSVWVTHARAIDKAQHLLAATHIAEARLTEQMGLSFRASNVSGTTRVRRFLDDVPTDYEYRWTIKVDDTTTSIPDIKIVTVTVEWDEQEQKRSIQIVTHVYWQG